jgi:hypothetical protein
MRLLAIDPGEKFGWAHATIDPANDDYVPPGQFEVTGHGITPAKDFIVKLFEAVSTYDVVVLESYRISTVPARLKAHAGSDVPTLQYIGAVRAACWLNPQVKLVTQAPATKKTADSTMPSWLSTRIAGLPKAHDDAHDGDALRHGWFFFWLGFVFGVVGLGRAQAADRFRQGPLP